MANIDFFDGREVFQDIVAVILTIVLIQLFILLNDFIKAKGYLSTTVTRKFIHIFAAPIYVFCWMLYSNKWYSPYFALIVPGLFAFQFILIGFGITKNEEFIQTMSRSGDPKELLRGPLYYAIFMMISAVLFWTSIPLSDDYSPVGIVAIMVLAFGDGFADIVGRTMNRMKFTIFTEKSIPGTLAMFVFSLLFSFIGLLVFGFDLEHLTLITIVACAVATLVEVASPKETDNVTIPIAVYLVFIVLAPVLSEDANWEIFNIFKP
ncbi:MAG: diacylglycerol/polyprenol kinase family protein [Candidatus Kariarchaeaceae archaeon]|jgi:dolichol kinase